MSNLINSGTTEGLVGDSVQMKDTLTSLELVEQINLFRKEEGKDNELLHKNLLAVIRDEFEEEIGQLKIQPTYYRDQWNRQQPMFVLTLSQAKQVLVRESKFVRKHVIAYIEQLEAVVKKLMPKTFIQALRAYADELEKNEQLRLEVGQQRQVIGELQPKATYYDLILSSVDCLTVTQIAKDYGMSAKSLNQFLSDKKVQFKQSGTWLLYQNHADKGYTKSETVSITYRNGEKGSKLNTKWTQKGRLFLYELLKRNNILPLMEQELQF